MGKVEKIVVLSVLFLIVLILTVSLTPDRDDPDRARDQQFANQEINPAESLDSGSEGTLPLTGTSDGGSLALAEPGAADWSRVEGGEVQLDDRAEGLLSSSVDTTTPPLNQGEESGQPTDSLFKDAAQLAHRPLPIPLDASWDLIQTTGLERTPNPELLAYQCQANETFDSVAKTLFGDKRLATLLRRNNETVDELRAGLRILVPVRDDMLMHLVVDGESLWKIASQHYKRGTDWKRIFEANRDQLRTPDGIKPGMKLMIPR